MAFAEFKRDARTGRFAFVEVTSPSEEVFDRLLEGPGSIVRQLLPLRAFRDLGPAVYLDAAKFAARRLNDNVSESRVVYETFYAFFLPQFEGMDDTRASALYRTMASMLEPTEQAEAVLLRVVMGLDVTTTAQVLGKRAGAVRTAAHRGLRRLAELMAEEPTDVE